MKRELIVPDGCQPEYAEMLHTLIGIRTTIFQEIIGQLTMGECSNLSDDMYGYPYDYELYSKDSLDPTVQKLNALLETVEKTFDDLVNEHTDNGR